MQCISDLIDRFINYLLEARLEVYNEFSLQHELGIYLRQQLPNYKVQFERNVSHFFSPEAGPFSKREIDISIFSADMRELAYAIELKFPRNGQYPESMFSICKDIAFAEELCAAGFRSATLIALAEDRLFYEGSSSGIYSHFRGQQPLHGIIRKPTGQREDQVLIRGHYVLEWKPVMDELRYLIVDAVQPQMLAIGHSTTSNPRLFRQESVSGTP